MEVGLALSNVLLGLGNIGAGVGFGVAEQKKMEELNAKANKLKTDVTTARNLYDQIYYLVAVNLDRVKKALDKLPSDLLDKLQDDITSDISASAAEQAVKTIAKVLGYAKHAAKAGSSLIDIVIYFRNRKANGEEPVEPTEDPPFESVPVEAEQPPVVTEGESSFPKSPTLTRIVAGLNIAGAVFGIAGLAATIGLGVWTLEKLNKAIEDVETKQKQVTAFQTAMEKALGQVAAAAGLSSQSYDQLTTSAATWKKMSENFDSYEKVLYYAIRGYFRGKSYNDIKDIVNKESDAGKPFPEEGYPLAKVLADDIKKLMDENKTDKDICSYFTNTAPKTGLRFAFSEYFISSLRSI